MQTIFELSTTIILIVLLIFVSYRKWKYWNEEEERISETGTGLTNVEKKKNFWANILYVNAIVVFIPLTCFVASITYMKTAGLISLIGFGISIKLVDYLINWFSKSKSVILHLIFLSIIGFSIVYFLILLINYDLLTTLKQN